MPSESSHTLTFPANSYVGGVEINADTLTVSFKERKKIALLFISLNPGYWPYLAQVIADCRTNFMPQHHVDIFVWSDYEKEKKKIYRNSLRNLYQGFTSLSPVEQNQRSNVIFDTYVQMMRLYNATTPEFVQQELKRLHTQGLSFRQEGGQYQILLTSPQLTTGHIEQIIASGEALIDHSFARMDEALKDVTLTETAGIEWPAPTLMRYHLFLKQEEKLKDYDQIFYLDADMRVVSKISDEVLSEGLTAAPHPGYAIAPKYIPPYEPNKDSLAYIPRLGHLVQEGTKQRFIPFYAAGGFQGGNAKEFITAMQVMKKKIDKDFDNNYTAVWNDESHWNKYLWDYQQQGGNITFLDPSYVYPDSLIKEYYEVIWGRSYDPKIVTLTKPFSLSMQGASELQKLLK